MLQDQHESDRRRRKNLFSPKFKCDTSDSFIAVSTTDLLNVVWKKTPSHVTYEYEKLLWKCLYH